MNIKDFRDGIFALRTRRFGSVAEIMIKKIYQLEESHKLEYDKYDSINDKKIEIKFSTVMKENKRKITETNVIEECLKATISNRTMKFKVYQNINLYLFQFKISQLFFL